MLPPLCPYTKFPPILISPLYAQLKHLLLLVQQKCPNATGHIALIADI